MSRLEEAAQAVADAWNVVGPSPEDHWNAKVRFTVAWPTLANAVEELAALMEPVDPYEYMVLRDYSIGGTQNKGSWSTKAEAETVFKALGSTGTDPTWGKWKAKLVKRMKAGTIEDA